MFRSESNTVFCFSCQQNLTEALGNKEEMEVSNNKYEKILDAHEKIIEISKRFRERLAERPLHPEVQKKAEKVKKEKNAS